MWTKDGLEALASQCWSSSEARLLTLLLLLRSGGQNSFGAGHANELEQLREEADSLREALDATEALCERQREEIRRLRAPGGTVRDDNDEARREAELMMVKVGRASSCGPV